MREYLIHDREGEPFKVKTYTVNEFDWSFLSMVESLKDYRRKRTITDAVAAFDIETTTYSKDLAWMYHWQFCVLWRGYYHIILGRTWDEYLKMIEDICKYNAGRDLVIFVHNLGFEYQFLRAFLPGHEVFAVKPRMPLKVFVPSQHTEYRCSWKLSNMSLLKATQKEAGVRFIKREDSIDYRLIRFPDTPISDSDMEYNILDVVSLCDYVYNLNCNNADTLVSMPMTSTGYVRRMCRNRIRKESPHYREAVFLKQRMTPAVYDMLKSAARGGNTHANRYHVTDLVL